jgi:hypothetical protein
MLRLGTILLLLLGMGQPLVAQLQKTYTIKYDPVGVLFGEYRLAYERKLTTGENLFVARSYFRKEEDDILKESHHHTEEETSPVKQKLRKIFNTDWNKFLYGSLGYEFRDRQRNRERLQGPVLRTGLRQYFLTEYAPQGPYIYTGLHYSFIHGEGFNELQETVREINLHRPGISLSAGYQRLFFKRKDLAVDVYAGFEYYYQIEQGDNASPSQFDHLSAFAFLTGLQIGFAFRNRNQHW